MIFPQIVNVIFFHLDVVIILNMVKGKDGFPSEIETSVNYQFINDTLPKETDEEARLFIVGLTRARNLV